MYEIIIPEKRIKMEAKSDRFGIILEDDFLFQLGGFLASMLKGFKGSRLGSQWLLFCQADRSQLMI